MVLSVSVVLVALNAISSISQLIKNPCFDFDTCDTCISHPRCKWIVNMTASYAKSPDTHKGRHHCVLKSSSTIDEADVYGPVTDTPAPDSVNQGGLNIDINHERIISQPDNDIEFNVKVMPKPATKLNVYFLVHLTENLQTFTNQIKSNFDAIVNDLKAVDRNVMMGIGKFSDIPVFPFVKLPTITTDNPNPEMPGYVFRNIQALDAVPTNTLTWKTHFTGSANGALDQPESVLDAMMQASECKDFIHWSEGEDVFRLMIVITDSQSKRAGHGNIIGHYRPNDGKCKMKVEEDTLKTINTDYVHPHLLEKSLSKNNIRLLILTDEDNVPYYKLLTESFRHQVIEVVDYATLDTDVKLRKKIEVAAKAQTRPIKFNLDHLKSEYDVSHFLECPNSDTKDSKSLECPSVAPNAIAKLSVHVRYSKSNFNAQHIPSHMKVNGFHEIIIDGRRSCTCTTEASNSPAVACQNKGRLVCGKCICDDNREGNTCQCDKPSDLVFGGEVECDETNNCGPHGKCVCGKCVCPNSPEQFYGPKCERTDLKCPFTQHGLCDGRGECKNGVCKCDPGYTERDCSKMDNTHPDKNNECKRTETSHYCSGRGDCRIGKCTCKKGFTGTYCESYKLPDVRCSDVKKCMLDYFASEQTGACSKPVTVVEKFSEELSYYTPICRVVYQSCVREFMIHINEDGKVIEVITVKQLIPSEECFHSPNFTKTVLVVLGITAGTTIATFVLACLIYYCYKNQRDQRSDEERLRRRWVLNTSGRYDITQPQEESTA